MKLNKQELEFTIQAIDRTPTSTLETVMMKGSLMMKLGTELHMQMQPPAEEPVKLKGVEKKK